MNRIFLVVFLAGLGFESLSQNGVSIKTFRESGLDCDWHPENERLVVYSQKGKDKYYDVHLADPDGTWDTCITCDHPELPNRHLANASWHPSGNWIIFVGEKKVHKGSSTDALPGFGAYCDIYLIRKDGKKVFRIVEIPNDYDHGVICPVFSPDGKKILWTDRIKRPKFLNPKRMFGYWNIKIADFSFGKDSVPEVKNVKALQPGIISFYESYGFSPDGKRIIFCSSVNEKSAWTQQIYSMDTSGTDLKQLTTTGYNEHSVYTPDGTHIVWMSNIDNKNKGCDWWIMKADGSEKTRLSFMNDPKHPHYQGKARWAGLASFNPAGTRFIAGMQLSLITQEGKIVIVDLR